MNNLLILLQDQAQGNPLMSIAPLVLVFAIFWFFIIRPQSKKQKQLRKFREELKKGDQVVTTGGIYGKITEIKDSAVTLQVDKGVNIKVDKTCVLNDMSAATPQK
ncbi:preprotein translocase subunit YajC [Prolixibacteraceae bacterium JC049]|nr:preprotein translocase subunit YajC [Prolixibacteraceae bacterium JC049]